MAQENYNTFDFTPYESNFATGRREELADRTAQEFYTNKAEYDITQRALGALEVTANDKKYVDALTAGVNSDMEGVLKTGRFDLGTYAVSDAVTRVMTDNKVKNSVETFAKRKEEDTRVAANPNEYKTYYNVPKMVHPDGTPFTAADYKDPNKRQFGGAEFDTNGNPIMIDLRDQWDSGVQGAYLGDSDKTLDHQARAYTMMKGIANDTVFIKSMIKAYKDKGMDIDAETAKKFIMSGQAITEGKVEGLAEKLLEMYSRTPEGQQRAKVLGLELSPTDREIPDVTGMGMSRSISQLNNDQEIQAALLNDLVTAGQTQIGMDISYSGIPQASGTTIINTPGTNVDTRSTAKASDAQEVDWDALFPGGKLVTSLKKERSDMGTTEWVINELDPFGVTGAGGSTSQEALKRVEEKLAQNDGDMNAVKGDVVGKILWLQKTYKDKIPKLNRESEKEYSIRLYNAILKGPQTQIERAYVMPPVGIDAARAQLAQGAGSLKIVSLDDEDNFKGTVLTFKEFDNMTNRVTGTEPDHLVKLPLALAGIDPKENGRVTINGVYPRGKLAGGTSITYIDKAGSVHNLVLGLNDKPLAQWREIGAMSDIIATGIDGKSKTIDVPLMTNQVTNGGKDVTYNKIKYENNYIADASGNITHSILVTYIDSRTNTSTKTRFNPNMLGEIIKGTIEASYQNGDTQGALFARQEMTRNTDFLK
jgi:hypothetical protein